MTVTVNTERIAVEVAWEEGDYEGQIQVFSVGSEGDVHNTAPQVNDGLAALSYPKNFSGRSAIEIRKADGSGDVVDSGVILIEDGQATDGGEIDPEDPRPDQTLPGGEPHPDQSLPGSQPEPDQTLPGGEPHPDQELPA